MSRPITDERVMTIARKYEAYPQSGNVVTLRGTAAILDFVRAVLAEHDSAWRAQQKSVTTELPTTLTVEAKV